MSVDGADRPASHRRLHVLHVALPTDGGLARVAGGYVRDQVERGWRVSVACPSVGDLGYAAREAGATVRWWRASAGGRLLGEVQRLGRIVADTGPDVVHLHGDRAGLAGRLAVRNRVPTVYQPHAWSTLAPRGTVQARPLRWERYAARWTSMLVCLSESERRLAESVGMHASSAVLPQGVDLARFRPAGPQDRVVARKTLGIDDVPTVLCVGELTVRKGQQDLLVDWPLVRRQVPGAQLVLVGDGPDRAALERLALDGVVFAGGRTDVPRWLAAADVVVVPSRWEGATLAPLEAMACARSVVASDAEGAAELLPEPAGAVVPRADGEAMAAALVRRLDDPRFADDEGWNGRAHVELHHDEASSARELAHVYLRLVGARRGR